MSSVWRAKYIIPVHLRWQTTLSCPLALTLLWFQGKPPHWSVGSPSSGHPRSLLYKMNKSPVLCSHSPSPTLPRTCTPSTYWLLLIPCSLLYGKFLSLRTTFFMPMSCFWGYSQSYYLSFLGDRVREVWEVLKAPYLPGHRWLGWAHVGLGQAITEPFLAVFT